MATRRTLVAISLSVSWGSLAVCLLFLADQKFSVINQTLVFVWILFIFDYKLVLKPVTFLIWAGDHRRLIFLAKSLLRLNAVSRSLTTCAACLRPLA